MADQEKTLEMLQALQDLTDKLTLKRVMTALLAGILTLGLYMFYENRATIADLVLQDIPEMQRDWTVSESMSIQLSGLVEQNSLVKMVLVEKIDLPRNRRIPKFWYVGNPLQADIDERMASHLPNPAFNHDSKNTQNLIGILNNEFICSKYEGSSLARVFPEMAGKVAFVCSIAVPPFYGRMIGALSFGLSVVPSTAELETIRLEATRLSVEIYLHDIAKRVR